MPLWVIIVAPAGVAAIVVLTWLLGGFYREPITREWLERFFGDEEPPLTVRDHVVGDDGRAALVMLEGEGLGVVTRVGDGLAWRPIGPEAEVSRVPAGFRIRLRIPTFPSVILRKSESGLPASIVQLLGPKLQE